MLLRPFQASDLETLVKIDRACFPPGISYSREELAGFIGQPNSETWVGEEGGEIVGFLISDRQPLRVAHIITIDVVARWRRQGVGKALMDAAEDWARRERLRLIYLETAEDNLAAQEFYRAQGYATVERLEGYYPNGRAAWVMVKRLTGKSKLNSPKSKAKPSTLNSRP